MVCTCWCCTKSGSCCWQRKHMDQNDPTASMRVLHNHGWCGMKSIVALFWCFVKHVDKVDVISYMTEERMGHKVSPIVVVHWSYMYCCYYTGCLCCKVPGDNVCRTVAQGAKSCRALSKIYTWHRVSLIGVVLHGSQFDLYPQSSAA